MTDSELFAINTFDEPAADPEAPPADYQPEDAPPPEDSAPQEFAPSQDAPPPDNAPVDQPIDSGGPGRHPGGGDIPGGGGATIGEEPTPLPTTYPYPQETPIGRFGPPSPGTGDTPPIPAQHTSSGGGQSSVPAAPNHDIPGLGAIMDWLHNALQHVEDTVGAITANIHDAIGGMIESLVPPTVAAITGLASIMGNLVQGLLNNLAPVTDVGQMIQDSLTGGMPLALQGFIDSAWEQRGENVSKLLSSITEQEELPDSIKSMFSAIQSGTSPVEKILGIFGLAGLLAAAGSTILGPVLEKAGQGANVAFRPTLPDVGIAVDLLRRNIIDREVFNGTLARQGYPDQWIDLLADATSANFSPEVLQVARNRGLLSDESYNVLYSLLGFGGAQTALFDQLRWQVPNFTDLVHFMTRDAFWDNDNSPFGNIVSDFQLNFGEDQLPFDKFAQAGVPEEMARWAWRAHWEIPGRHDANEMFFRGTLGDRDSGGEGERILERVYRARGIEPRFIQPLIATAYHPIGRIDIRRLVKQGSMDRDGAIEAYRQIGYNGDNAVLLADLAIALVNSESNAEKEPFRGGLKSRLVAAYINGTLSADETTAALTELHYHDAAIATFISEANVERIAILNGHIRQGVQRLYTSGEWQLEQAQKYLSDHGFAQAEIDQLSEWWSPIRELSDLKAEHRQHKEATRADILAAYTDDVIDRNTANDHLGTLGYNADDAEMFLSLIDHRKAKGDISAEIGGIQAAYLDRQIDAQGAIHELDSIGIHINRRNGLLRKWQLELDRRQPDLPLAMVEKLAIAKLYSFDELTAELHHRHFSAEQIDKFRALWGYEIEVAATRLKTQSEREVQAELRRKDAEQRRIEAEQRRQAAHIVAEQRRAEADARRHIADERRAASDARAARLEAQREHDRMARDAHAGRLSVARIRTAFTLGIISENQATQLFEAIGLRPETAAMELEIIHEQLRAKELRISGSGGGTATIQAATVVPIP